MCSGGVARPKGGDGFCEGRGTYAGYGTLAPTSEGDYVLIR